MTAGSELDDDALEGLVAALEAALGRVEAAVLSVAPGAWDEVIHTGDGAWTRRQLLAHMAANDQRQLVRIRVGAGIPEADDDLAKRAGEDDVHAWNQARVKERSGRSIDELLAEMRANRAQLVALLRRLTPAQRALPMPFRGTPTPLEDMVPVVIGHLDQHAAELTAT